MPEDRRHLVHAVREPLLEHVTPSGEFFAPLMAAAVYDPDLDFLIACDDLDVSSQADAVHDDLRLDALIDQGFADNSAGVPGDLVQQDDARGVVVGVRGEDDDCADQAENVHGRSACAAGHPLGRIVATRGGGTPAPTWTLWVSRITRVGSSDRRAHSWTWQRGSPWATWSVPSSRSAAKQ
ncbi:hypothetical protein GCM10011578_009120 [Streptomyces fuscichromogenes]|uniref:Uncharacterized protein n=1 Tax=Streptomyces fuscichromogenes TaxID=1324013 RepID=A0A917UIH8_9ACTN|nr:hypothetical protein GCM10011578_009120 [Streptomyces fuscichromogenes]